MATLSRSILTDLIADAKTALEAVDTERREAQEAVRKIMERRQEIVAEIKAYEATFARHYPDKAKDSAPATDPAPIQADVVTSNALFEVKSADDWSTLPRTVAVERAVDHFTAIQGHASVSDIFEFLQKRNRHDTRDHIGGATAHLNRNHQIHSGGRAMWISGPPTETSPQQPVAGIESEVSTP